MSGCILIEALGQLMNAGNEAVPVKTDIQLVTESKASSNRARQMLEKLKNKRLEREGTVVEEKNPYCF